MYLVLKFGTNLGNDCTTYIITGTETGHL